jgi:hypothetical protein
MSRNREPALYELISQKQSLLKPAERSDAHDDIDLEHNVITPGRSVRMPLGTIAVFVAVGIAMIMISYMLGYRKGTANAREDYANQLVEQQSVPIFSEVQPDTISENWLKPPVLTPKIPQNPVVATSFKTQKTVTKNSGTPINGPISSDPRIAGMWYFTLMTTTESGATKLAAFCEVEDLVTCVINSANTRYFEVIALPGSTEQYDATMADTLSKIRAIGRKWAGTTDGRGSDLRDAYRSMKQDP